MNTIRSSIRPVESGADAQLRASAALLMMVIIWAVNFAVAKRALDLIAPLAFNALRFPLAALVVLFALRMRGPVPLPERRDVWKVLALGVLGNVLYQQFFVFGLANTRAGVASVLLAGTPIATTLLSALLGHERIRPLVWAGVLASFAGIVLVVLADRAAQYTTYSISVADLYRFQYDT
ncbi:MAG: DMT family transporter, partial [Longimicrobiales bacterium]